MISLSLQWLHLFPETPSLFLCRRGSGGLITSIDFEFLQAIHPIVMGT